MQTLEKDDVIKPVRIITPVKVLLPGGGYAVNRNIKAVIVNNKVVAFPNLISPIITNEQVWDYFVPIIKRRSPSFFIDPVNTEVTDIFMALHIVFPETKMWDGKSKLSLSIWLFNYYDKVISFRFRFGTYRWTSSAASYVGSNLLSAIHMPSKKAKLHYATKRKNRSKEVQNHFDSALTYALKLYPTIQERINELQTVKPTPQFIKACNVMMGKIVSHPTKYHKMLMKGEVQVDIKTAYDLYCDLISYTSHHVIGRPKISTYNQIAKAFNL